MIPFNRPMVTEKSKQYAMDVLSGDHQHGDGKYSIEASKMISKLVGGGEVMLTPSCTHALEMASMLANIGPGDEVILPSYTFTSAATAITKFGGSPIFVDIDPSTKGIDVQKTREAITNRTKAISWVNYAGIAPDIDGIKSLAKEFGLILIEDNAHGLGGTYKGKPLGSFGDFATQSFHATKNIQCGEGGAIVINDLKYTERAEIIREKGTDRSKFLRGEVQKYKWVDQGSSYLLAESLAAILLGQLECFEEIQNSRKSYWEAFKSAFPSEVFDSGIRAISIPENEVNVAHMFYVEIENLNARNQIENHFGSNNISLNRHYQPLHSAGAIKNLGISHQKDCFNSTAMADSLYRIPLWSYMNPKVVNEIVEVIEKIKISK